MRIISGYARGLKLQGPKDQSIRPTSDRAREALFSIIGGRVRGALVLDLFSGTGAFGLEALSRGARHVTFVDHSPEAIRLVNKNLQLLQKIPPPRHAPSSSPTGTVPVGGHPSVAVLQYDLRKGTFYTRTNDNGLCSRFDLIFLDPPYEKGLSLQALAYLDSSMLLAENGLLIAEDRAETDFPPVFGTLTLIDRRRYGEAGFWFYAPIPAG